MLIEICKLTRIKATELIILQCTYNILEHNNSVIQKRATKFVIEVNNMHEKSANSIILRCTYNILEYNNSVRLYKKELQN